MHVLCFSKTFSLSFFLFVLPFAANKDEYIKLFDKLIVRGLPSYSFD